MDLVRLCYLRAQSAGFPPDLHIAQHPLLDRLVPLMVLSELDHSTSGTLESKSSLLQSAGCLLSSDTTHMMSVRIHGQTVT